MVKSSPPSVDWPAVLGDLSRIMYLREIAAAVGCSTELVHKLRRGEVKQPSYDYGARMLKLRSQNVRAIRNAKRRAA